MATVEEIAPLDPDPDVEEKKEDNAESQDDIKDKTNLEHEDVHSSGPNDVEPWTMLDKDEPESDRKDENKDEGICTSEKGHVEDVQHTILASGRHNEGKVDVIEEREALTNETESTGEENEVICEKIGTVCEGNEVINDEKVDVIEEGEALTNETETKGEENEAICEKIGTFSQEKEDISENTGPATENTGVISEEKEPFSNDNEAIIENKEDIIENTEAISEESEDIIEEKDDTCEEKGIIIEPSEYFSKETGTVNEEEQTIIDESEVVTEEKMVISEKTEGVSDDSKNSKEDNGTISGEIETICVNIVAISEVLGNFNEEKGDTYEDMEDISGNDGDVTEELQDHKATHRDGSIKLQDHKDLDDDNELVGNNEYNKDSGLQDNKDTGLEYDKIDALAPCDVGQEEEIIPQVGEYEENDTSNYFLSGLMVVLIAIVIGPSMGHFLGLIVSVITNISPGLLGLGPDPEAGPNFGLGINPSDYTNEDINPSDYDNADIDPHIGLEDDPSEYYSNGFIDPNTGLRGDTGQYNIKEDMDPSIGVGGEKSEYSSRGDMDQNIGLGDDKSEYSSRGDMHPNFALGNDPTDQQTAGVDGKFNSDAVMNEIDEADIAGHTDSISGAQEEKDAVESVELIEDSGVEMIEDSGVEMIKDSGVEVIDDSGVEVVEDSGVEELDDESVLSSFDCMGLDGAPILVDGVPAVVKDPVDCTQYFNLLNNHNVHNVDNVEAGDNADNVEAADNVGNADTADTADNALTAPNEHVAQNAHDEPPKTFVSAAKNVFKSADQAEDERLARQLWNQNGQLRNQVESLKTTGNDQGEGAIKVILTKNSDIKKQVDKLRISDAEPAETQKKPSTHSPSPHKKTSKNTHHPSYHQKQVEEDEDDDDDKQEDGDDDDDEGKDKDNEGKTLLQFINYLSEVIGDIVKNIVKDGMINFIEAKRLVESLKVNAGKFDKMRHTSEFKKHVSETHKVTVDFGKGLVEAVRKLSEGGKKTTESEFNKFKYQLEKRWRNTEETYKRIIEDITAEENEVKNVLEFTEYLSGVIGNIVSNIVQDGQVNFKEAKRLVESLKENAGKFDKMAHTNKMKKQVSEIQKVTANFGKGLVEAVKKLSEERRKPTESDLNKFKYQLEKNWRSTEETYKKIITDITGNDNHKDKNTKKYEQRKNQKHFRETKKNVEYKYKDSKNEYEHRRNNNDDDDDKKDSDHYKTQKHQFEKRKREEYSKEPPKNKGKQQKDEYKRKDAKNNFGKQNYD